jgi:hypothetical protein
MVMGAAHGTEWLPTGWTKELTAAAQIDDLLRQIQPDVG